MKKIGAIERVNSLTSEKFHSQYVLRNNPVIIQDAVTFWRGYQLWSLDYLVKTIGDIKVRYYISQSNLHPDLSFIKADKLDQKVFFNEGTLAQFIALLKKAKNVFLAGDELSFFDKKKYNQKLNILEHDFEIPKLIDRNTLHSGGLWISPKNIVSWLHYDQNGCHNLNAQIKGSKDILLFPPRNLQNYYLNSGSGNKIANFSQVNILDPDYLRFPLFGQAAYLEGRLNEGDILFIPAYWLHSFKHLGDININLNFWWG
ncbi:cupin-like domain-containing protein [Fluoribacter dumoffii]|uniref:cupin-like domain-containing protein n=1 Tax=Fluoribacter dumoffii TaxID=463 RepID=UPI002242EFD8|nr:cupin-like domain-containing protein [Fluoribacter dumoffii]MCW8416885.1 cupin-like domain-containing protein [Fluoribacter dumoffii]MCW8455275.1 cupin-like domain-containing protein [Fluoribacter dumoffii]MCW8460647.1 cupin-like domain-containing protein [Fluoribacter dumoffii]MCW8484128.1 cupin-like domain-containing protein [Fluoribacter dumoffii]